MVQLPQSLHSIEARLCSDNKIMIIDADKVDTPSINILYRRGFREGPDGPRPHLLLEYL